MYEGEMILEHAWIYIAIDASDLSRCKVGYTARENLNDRIKEGRTSCPYYRLFNGYKLSMIGISKKELRDFESYLHRRLGDRIINFRTKNETEWINITPFEAEKELEYRIGNSFISLDNESFFNEDGSEINVEVMNKIKSSYRPCPAIFSEDYERCKEYVDFLIDYHNPIKSIICDIYEDIARLRLTIT